MLETYAKMHVARLRSRSTSSIGTNGIYRSSHAPVRVGSSHNLPVTFPPTPSDCARGIGRLNTLCDAGPGFGDVCTYASMP